MDTYASRVTTCKAPFDSEADAKEQAILENYTSPWVRISVEGFDRFKVPESKIENKLIERFESCGQGCAVVFPTERLLDRRVFVTFRAHDDDAHVAKEKALQLNGSDMGGWNALVKFAPEEEEEEYQVALRYENSQYADLANDKRFLFGVAVWGYDTSLPVDVIESKLRAHFSSCGEIVHVFVDPDDNFTNIYFSKEEGEASAVDLYGSLVDGFEIMTMLISTTVRCNTPLPPGETRIGRCIPAHMLEFADEMQVKMDFYMTEWRLNSMTKKLRALKKQKSWALGEPKAEAQGRSPRPGGLLRSLRPRLLRSRRP